MKKFLLISLLLLNIASSTDVDKATYKKFRDAGFNDKDIEFLVPLLGTSLSAKYFKNKWVDKGYSLKELEEWKGGQFNDGFLSYLDISKVVKWKEAGFSAKDAKEWHRVDRRYPKTAMKWKKAGFTPDEARVFAQFGLGTAREYKKNGIEKEWVKPFKSSGKDYKSKPIISEILSWKSLGFTAETAKVWLDQGFVTSDWNLVNKYKSAGAIPLTGGMFNKFGISPEESIKINKKINDRCKSIETLSWMYEANPYDTEGVCFVVRKTKLNLLDGRTRGVYRNGKLFYVVSFEDQSAPKKFTGIVTGIGIEMLNMVDGTTQTIPDTVLLHRFK